MLDWIKENAKLLAIVAIAAAGALTFSLLSKKSAQHMTVSVKVPQLSSLALEGQDIFNKNCSICHGKSASGTDQGPPLIHKIYEPSHHSDGSFILAARRGVQSHHWPYGDMPPIPTVNEQDVLKIIRYVREVQRANGIF